MKQFLKLLLFGLLWSGCAFSVSPTDGDDSLLAMQMASYPERISVEDSTATAEIWVTLKRGSKPIPDSTVVVFATTVGTITSATITRDGLAIAVLTGPGDGTPRSGIVVAQALTVRDTLEVGFIIPVDN